MIRLSVQDMPEELTAELSHCIEEFIEQNQGIVRVLADPEMKVISCNGCFRKLAGMDDPAAGVLIGDHISVDPSSVFPELDGEMVNLYLEVGPDRTVVDASVFRRKGYFLITGAVIRINDGDVLRKMTALSNETANLSRDLKRRNRELREANDKINSLSGIIPICMHCKEIRDDDGYWDNIEHFLSDHTAAEFSHSICERCAEKLFSLH